MKKSCILQINAGSKLGTEWIRAIGINRPYSVRLAYRIGRVSAWPNKSDRHKSGQVKRVKCGSKGLHNHLLRFGGRSAALATGDEQTMQETRGARLKTIWRCFEDFRDKTKSADIISICVINSASLTFVLRPSSYETRQD